VARSEQLGTKIGRHFMPNFDSRCPQLRNSAQIALTTNFAPLCGTLFALDVIANLLW